MLDLTNIGPELNWDRMNRPGKGILIQHSMRTATNVVTVKMEVDGMTNGQIAGLCHFSFSYNADGDEGHADFDWFHYEYSGPTNQGKDGLMAVFTAEPLTGLRPTQRR